VCKATRGLEPVSLALWCGILVPEVVFYLLLGIIYPFIMLLFTLNVRK
jgi:hypothetical protein